MSYTLYAVHLPVITLWTAYFGVQTFGLQFGLLAAIAVVTVLGYRWVEAPSHRAAQKRRVSAPAAALV